MKIRISKESKKWMTLAQAPVARQMVLDGKDPEMYGNITNEECVELAAIAWLEYHREHNAKKKCGVPIHVLEASAKICNNQRLVDYWSKESGMLDVWVEGTVKCSRGFLEIGAYLSDILQLGSDAASETLVNHSNGYVYTECK